jgi:sortase A
MTEEPPDTTSPVRILIPDLNLDTEVKYVPYDGYSWLIQGLQWEVAWMGDTSWPGLGGNTSIAGHVTLRNGSDGPFRYLENLQMGSEIILSTEKNLYHYKVGEKRVVDGDDLSVLSPTERPTLTLITCADWDTNLKIYLKRLIVSAELDKVVPLASGAGG